MKREPIVLPADVYDTFELSAFAFGGIGAGNWFEHEAPCCAVGHQWDAEIPGNPSDYRGWWIGAGQNDWAVIAINRRLRRNPYERVSWRPYCRELNIQRADS